MSEIDDLFALLRGTVFAPPNPVAGDPNQIPQQGPIGDGNIQPVDWYSGHAYSSSVGQSNLLCNPGLVMFDAPPLTTSGVAQQAAPWWSMKYVLNSGTDIVDKPSFTIPSRRGINNPHNTDDVCWWMRTLASAASRDLDFYVYPTSGWNVGAGPVLPFLTASVRIFHNDGYAVPAHYTTADVYLEIVRNSDGAVVATTAAFALSTLGDFGEHVLTAWTEQTIDAFQASLWIFRLRLHLVSDGSATTQFSNFGFAEAQLSTSYTPDPPPFTPALARWFPDKFYAYDDGKNIPNLQITNGSAGFGELLFGSGDAVGDLRVTRTAAKTLEIADGESHGPATLRIVGLRQAVPKAAQSVEAGTAIVADYEVVQVQSTGNVTVAAAPTIADGVDGQMLTIVNVDAADTITLQDQGTLASSNLRLVATTIALAPRQSIQLMYSSTVGDWVQIGNKVAVL